MQPTHMTFFERFESDIVSGKKVITLRDESESHYVPNTQVTVGTLETNRHFGKLDILSVTPIAFDDLNEIHAKQENMTLETLKTVIQEIYPNIRELFVIEYRYVK